MQTPNKRDLLAPIIRQQLRQDFPAGFSEQWDIPSQTFPRLSEGEATLLSSVAVSADYDGRDHLSISLETTARLACARCLLPMDLFLQAACRFQLFETAAQADKALDALDETEPVCDEDRIGLRDLIEDEVLLRLSNPHVHPACYAPVDSASSRMGQGSSGTARQEAEPGQVAGGDSAAPRQRPFAGLDQLLSIKTSRKKS